MLSDLQLVYMVHRNSTQLLIINTTKFQVEHEPVYPNMVLIGAFHIAFVLPYSVASLILCTLCYSCLWLAPCYVQGRQTGGVVGGVATPPP